MPLWKGILVNVAVIIVVVLLMVSANKLNLKNIWVPFLGLSVWACYGMKMEMKEMAKVWIGAAVAIFMSILLVWAPAKFGLIGFLIPGSIIFVFMLSMVMNKLQMVFNLSTAIFLTVCTGFPQALNVQYNYYIDLLFGALLFWLLPQLIIKVMEKRSATESVISR